MLTAALALSGGEYRLSGVPRMHERPIGDLVDAPAPARRRHHLHRQRGLPPLHLARHDPSGGVVRVRATSPASSSPRC